MKPRIAVIGGGVFGLMCAARLGEAGFVVHLFERHRDLMQGASAWSTDCIWATTTRE